MAVTIPHPTCEVKFQELRPIYGVAMIAVREALDDLTTQAEIQLPRYPQLRREPLRNYIQVGHSVEIRVGYNHDNHLVFRGYVSTIDPNDTGPIRLRCEDEMYQLKRRNITASYSTATGARVADILPLLYDGPINAVDLDLGPIRFNNASGAEALDKITEFYGQRCFFRLNSAGEAVLTVGKGYDANLGTTLFESGRNVPNLDGLSFVLRDDAKLQIKGINNLPNGQKQTFEVGPSDGAVRTRNYYNLPQASFEQAVRDDYDKLRYDGYQGTFRTFGAPLVQAGSIVEIKDVEYPERQGRFFVDAVDTTFGPELYQSIRLGPKAS